MSKFLVASSLTLFLSVPFFAPNKIMAAPDLNNETSSLQNLAESQLLQAVSVYAVVKKPEKTAAYEFIWAKDLVQSDTYVSPLFLSQDDARPYVNALVGSGEKQAMLMVTTLYDAKKGMVSYAESQKSSGIKFLSPIIVPSEVASAARGILLSSGMSDEDINDRLRIPVFYTEPVLIIGTNQGPKKTFFLEKEPLDRLIGSMAEAERQKLQVKVSDLSMVLNMVSKSSNPESYSFYPTEATLLAKPSAVTSD